MDRSARFAAWEQWLRHFFPGYFAGIVSIAARLQRWHGIGWALLGVDVIAYPVLWIITLTRLIRFPRAILTDFTSHARGPAFLTVVAATSVLGSQFAVHDILPGLMPWLFGLALLLWVVLVYGFLSTVTISAVKPDLEHGLNGAWLLLVVATESIAVLGGSLAMQRQEPPALVFACAAFYLLGGMLYILLAALIFFRCVFRPMSPAEMGAPW